MSNPVLEDATRGAVCDDDVVVDVNHVSMIFNMASEQLNSMKEYFIKLAKRELMFKSFVALDDISFQVRKGEVFGLVGTNGSGKSTMLKIVAGVLEPSKGTCTAKGVIAPLIELGAGFDMELTARENIYLNGALLGYTKQYINEHFDEIVDFAELHDFLDMPMKNYSSGMVARIAFAVATVIVPDILIVDETLSVGDQFFQEKCEKRISELIQDYGVTVLFVSHSFAQVQRICQKVVWIEKGKMRKIGPVDDIAKLYSFRVNGMQVALVQKGVDRSFPSLEDPASFDGKGLVTADAHIAFVGWKDGYSEGAVVGTLDESQSLEALRLRLDDSVKGSIRYNVAVKSTGWQRDPSFDEQSSWFADGAMAGTEGESKHLEALQIVLSGAISDEYDVLYRIHSESFGWSEWAENGEIAGIDYWSCPES
ncbi:ATP-binding cassette domain-containing protein [Adlercreutzia sp. ZJ473]|uniref:ATP-binding cassette domain-containing protein n=1 Tax=Adlercreutzia sp. ZJ473 TaxID=2722822 RepID=UPI0015576587|nr:ATP-binding cassette domain-containing protein [Adlercreutzia sp. ZJ473]